MTTTYQPAIRATQPGERVGPLRAIRNFFRRGFQFSGRASRSEYWWITLFGAVLYGGYDYADESGHLEGLSQAENTGLAMLALLLYLAVALVSVLCLVFSIALSVRRLHDANLSGLWYLLILVPVLGSLALLILSLLPPDPVGARFDNQLLPEAQGPGAR